MTLPSSLAMELYKVPVYRRYIAGRVSCASCVRLVSLVVVILVPFFLAFVSHAFWRKEGVHYEQATVRFKHQAVVMTRGQDAGGAQSLIFSAVDADKFVSGSHVRAPMTRVRVGMEGGVWGGCCPAGGPRHGIWAGHGLY